LRRKLHLEGIGIREYLGLETFGFFQNLSDGSRILAIGVSLIGRENPKWDFATSLKPSTINQSCELS
jgi:hypothetical protein